MWKTTANVPEHCTEENTITLLAGSGPSKERYFASSLWVCTSGGENSSFVHKLQNTLWNWENNRHPISQVVKQEHSELETSQWKTFFHVEKITLITQSDFNRRCVPVLCKKVLLMIHSCLVSLNTLPRDLCKPGVICFPVELNLSVHLTITAEEMAKRMYVLQMKYLSSLSHSWEKR